MAPSTCPNLGHVTHGSGGRPGRAQERAGAGVRRRGPRVDGVPAEPCRRQRRRSAPVSMRHMGRRELASPSRGGPRKAHMRARAPIARCIGQSAFRHDGCPNARNAGQCLRESGQIRSETLGFGRLGADIVQDLGRSRPDLDRRLPWPKLARHWSTSAPVRPMSANLSPTSTKISTRFRQIWHQHRPTVAQFWPHVTRLDKCRPNLARIWQESANFVSGQMLAGIGSVGPEVGQSLAEFDRLRPDLA